MKKSMKHFWQNNHNRIILATVMILLSLLAFALGYLTAEYSQKEPIEVINHNYPS